MDLAPTPSLPRGHGGGSDPRQREGRGRYVGGNEPSIYALQRRGFALLDRPAARAVVAEELARQALIGHRRGRVGRLRAAPADIGKPVFGAAQAEIGGLLTRLAGSCLLDRLLGLLVGGLLLRPRRPRRRRAQIKIRRDRQRRTRFDRELVGQCRFEADRLLEIAAARGQRQRSEAKSARDSNTAVGAANRVTTEHDRNLPNCLILMHLSPQKQAVEQHRRDAQTDGAVGNVESRPVPGAEVKIEKIDDRAETNAIDDIANGAADGHPDRDREQRALDTPQPKDQHCNDNSGQERKQQHVHPAGGVEEPEADAAIKGQAEVEEWRDRLVGADRAPGEEAENGGFAELIDDYDRGRRAETSGQHQPAPTPAAALLRSTTSAQRRQRSSCPGTWPTSGSTRQQRSQRSPGAAEKPAPRSATSGSVNAPPGTGPLRTVPAEMMQSSARSITRSRSISRSGTNSSTAACRLDPSLFPARSSSSAPVTTRRRSRNTRHRSSSASSHQSAGTSGNSSRWTLRPGASPCRASHASSAVKQMTGASQRVRQSKQRSSTVRTARRLTSSGASQ